MTSASFRKLALALPGAEEHAHMNHPDFRVGGRIFATMGYPRTGWAMVALTPEDQVSFVAMRPEAFAPVKGKWGEQGATNVILRHARVPTVRAALAAAYQTRVNKTATQRRTRKATRSTPRAT
jgi:YjbR